MMNRLSCALNLSAGGTPPVQVLGCLPDHVVLSPEDIQLVRNQPKDSLFGRSAENGIIW